MKWLLIALGFEPCPLCAAIKGHAPGCPYGGGRS